MRWRRKIRAVGLPSNARLTTKLSGLCPTNIGRCRRCKDAADAAATAEDVAAAAAAEAAEAAVLNAVDTTTTEAAAPVVAASEVEMEDVGEDASELAREAVVDEVAIDCD